MAAGKARVHELAKELGVTSKEVLARLSEQGEFVKSASSTVEAPVARRLRESFGGSKPAPAKGTAKSPGKGPDKSLDKALHTAIGLTAPGGRTITVGLPPPDVRISLSPLDFVTEGRSLIGSYLGSAVPSHDIPRFVSLWQSGRLPVESLVTSTIRLDDINEAMDHLADGIAVRQLISFTGDL